MNKESAQTIEDYICRSSPEVPPVLRKMRDLIRKFAPEAKETISYRMPAFRRNGILLYFAAFNSHIGMFPAIKGDPGLEKKLERFRGPKGNLRFRLNDPSPYKLTGHVAALRVAQDALKATNAKQNKNC